MRLERAEVVEVVDLDVGQDRAVQRQLQVGAVALVGLDDEPLAARPLRPGAHVGDVATDDEARPPAGLGEDQHQHRRRGRLAVRAGDGRATGPARRSTASIPARRSTGDAGGRGLVELDVRRRHRARGGDRAQPCTTCGGRGRRARRRRAARSRSSTGCSRMSLPLTAWPISARTMAIALIPGPPTPTTCSRCGVAEVERCDRRRSRSRRSHPLDHVDQRARCDARAPIARRGVGRHARPAGADPPSAARSRRRAGRR